MRGRASKGAAQALVALALALASPVAQPVWAEQAVSVLTLDWDKTYTGSLWGQRVEAELAAQSKALNQENAKIAADLEEEERKLTTRRPQLSSEAFRSEADAFDARVSGIRKARDAKAQSLTAAAEAERATFLARASALLDEELAERKASVVIDSRAIIRGLGASDVSESLRARMDARYGDGKGEAAALER